MIPEAVQAVVHNHLTLTGNVEWLYQKESAERAVRHVRGVRGVVNQVTVAPKAAVRDVRRRIVRALHQSADVDARQITVTVSDNTATLTGTVGTWLQRDAAERAAAKAPGIAHVENRLTVQSFHDSKAATRMPMWRYTRRSTLPAVASRTWRGDSEVTSRHARPQREW